MNLPSIPDDLQGGIEIKLESWEAMRAYLYSDWKSELIKRGFSVEYIEADGGMCPFRVVRVRKGANDD